MFAFLINDIKIRNEDKIGYVPFCSGRYEKAQKILGHDPEWRKDEKDPIYYWGGGGSFQFHDSKVQIDGENILKNETAQEVIKMLAPKYYQGSCDFNKVRSIDDLAEGKGLNGED